MSYEHIRAPSMEQAMQMAGYPVPKLSPGRIVRFRNGGHSLSGWAKLFPDGMGGVFGDWREGMTYVWHSDEMARMLGNTGLRKHLLEQLEMARAQEERARELAQQEAAAKARAIWSKAGPARHDHPYLLAKGVQSSWTLGEVRERMGALLIPVCDLSAPMCPLVSLQFISPNGDKRFLARGRMQGCGMLIDTRPAGDGPIVICEGYATALTLANHYARGALVVAAFNAGNLVHVALAMRRNAPDAEMVIAADNDHATEGNPGLSKAREAAAWARAKVISPATAELGSGTDFNDLYQRERETGGVA